MAWYQRLRWQLVGIQLLIITIGSSSLWVVARFFLTSKMGALVIRPNLAPYIDSPETIANIEAAILAAFQLTISTALLIAVLGAFITSLFASFILWRILVTPLREIATSSQRVADGHYDERVPVPERGGVALRQVVTNFNHMATWLETTEQKRVAMVGNVAHELRTPLTGLRGVIEGMEDGIYQPDPETFQRLSKELDRLSRMIDDLQSLSRAEAGAVQLHFHDFKLNDVVCTVLTHLQAQADSKQINVIGSEHDPVLYVHADNDRTAQIITNLISNAIRYTPTGGTIYVNCTQNSNLAQVVVTDTGVGISAENLPLLFERFYRVDSSRSRHSGGSGVGLTIARHLTWAMGGELRASSTGEGQGSTFTLTLPLANNSQRIY